MVYRSFFLGVVITFFFGIAGVAYAADCSCELQIGAEECNVTKNFSYDWGQSVALDELVAGIPVEECAGNIQGQIAVFDRIGDSTQFAEDNVAGTDNCNSPGPNDPPRQYNEDGININFACSTVVPAAPPGQCACRANIAGLLCTASAEQTFEEGEQLNLRQFVTSLLEDNGCNLAASAAGSFVPDQNVVMNKENCNSVNQSGDAAGHTFSVQCSYSGQSGAAGAAGPAGGAPTIPGAQTDKIENKLPEVELPNPLKEVNLNRLIGRIIREAMGVLGSITLVVFVYGGYLFLTAAGNEEKVKKGGRAMAYAAVGIFIILTSYVILNTVFKAVF